jgi:hypothetical protein
VFYAGLIIVLIEKILSNKRDRLAPDHDEIYRVKMPIGATAKTREILKKAADLKSKGIKNINR